MSLLEETTMLYSIVNDYSHLEPHMNVALVPVKDLNVSEKYSIAGNITVYPKNSLIRKLCRAAYWTLTFWK